jgi:hypothetical protein
MRAVGLHVFVILLAQRLEVLENLPHDALRRILLGLKDPLALRDEDLAPSKRVLALLHLSVKRIPAPPNLLLVRAHLLQLEPELVLQLSRDVALALGHGSLANLQVLQVLRQLELALLDLAVQLAQVQKALVAGQVILVDVLQHLLERRGGHVARGFGDAGRVPLFGRSRTKRVGRRGPSRRGGR